MGCVGSHLRLYVLTIKEMGLLIVVEVMGGGWVRLKNFMIYLMTGKVLLLSVVDFIILKSEGSESNI